MGDVDSRTSVEVMEIFQRLNAESGITVLLITHEHDIADYGSRIVRFRDGTIIANEINTTRRMAGDEIAAFPTKDGTSEGAVAVQEAG